MERNRIPVMLSNERGMALFFVMAFFLTAMLGLTSLGRLGASHARTAAHNTDASQAFYLMESASERAKLVLRNNFLAGTGDSAVSTLGGGQYFYNISLDPDGDATKRLITGYGAIPNFANPTSNRTVEVLVQSDSDLPPNFWDYAIYAAGEIDANGNSYEVDGDCITGDEYDLSHDHLLGDETVDSSINPLVRFNFEYMKSLAQSQTYNGHDNYYTAAEVAAGDFPTDFYYQEPDPMDPGDKGIPHVVFIEGDLTLNGNWGNIGGFVVVVGDILTDPDASADTTINGNGNINGVVYTLGEFTVNGGGGGINVDGGVFVAEDVQLNGNTQVNYNQDYMDAIEALNLPTGLTVLSWNEVESDL